MRYAWAVNELKYANGRTEMGAVIGSKNLQAMGWDPQTRVPTEGRLSFSGVAQVVEPEVRDARFPARRSEAVLYISDVLAILEAQGLTGRAGGQFS
jgi:hypothetical protein